MSKKAAKSGKKGKAADDDILATCPVNGAGWCPYPFSVSQLKKKLKAAKAKKEQK